VTALEIHTTKMSQDNCIVLPLAIRKKLQLEDGDEVALLIENDKVTIEKVGATKRDNVHAAHSEAEDEFWEENTDDHDSDTSITKFR
jgi:AbrB family looped-hinge helix DNA binding protein